MAGSAYYNLTTGEKDYVKSHPWNATMIAWNKEIAFDKSDAFRHCFWSALLARDIGDSDAKEFTDLHESSPLNPLIEKSMDIHNNRIGISIGREGGSDVSLANACYKALKSRQLKVIK